MESFQLDDWLIDPELNRLTRHGKARHLEPKAMDVLATLLRSEGEVVTTETLLETVWAGKTVEPGAVHQKIRQIRKALGDDAARPRYVETVHRRGYRLLVPARRIVPGQQPAPAARPSPARTDALATPTDILRLVVLPLRNYTGDSGLDWVAGGMTEHLRRSIALWGLVDVLPGVIVRDASLRDLDDDAEFVVDGFLRLQEQQIVAELEIIDLTRRRTLLWESFSAPSSDLMGLQRQISENLARVFSIAVSGARPGPSAAQAFPDYLRFLHLGDYGELADEITALERVLELDPYWSFGWATLSRRRVQLFAWLGDADQLRLAEQALDHAKRTGQPDDWYLAAAVLAAYGLGDLVEGERMFRKMVSVLPEWYGILMLNSGLDQETARAMERVALDAPHQPTVWEVLSSARYRGGDHVGALDASRRLVRLNPPGSSSSMAVEALVCTQTGNLERARELHRHLEKRWHQAGEGTLAKRVLEFLQIRVHARLANAEGNPQAIIPDADWLLAQGQHARAAIYLFISEDPRLEHVVARAARDPPYPLLSWFHDLDELTPEQRGHAVIQQLERQLGITPAWRQEFRRRLRDLPPDSGMRPHAGA